MGQRRFVAPPNNQIVPCPNCGNNRYFTAKSMQVAEDCCDLWLECKCGYDPTVNTTRRIEDVWGSLDNDNIHFLISEWNGWIQEDGNIVRHHAR